MSKFLKPISFNDETETEMLEHLDNIGMAFATYVKKLIKQDMEKKSQESEVSELVSVMREMIDKSMNMPQMMMAQMMAQMGQVNPMLNQGVGQVTNLTPDEPEKPVVSNNQKTAINNIMKNLKR